MSRQVPEKVYIIHQSDNEKSVEYSTVCRRSCKYVKLDPEMVDWPTDIDECWKLVEHLNIKDHGTFHYSLKLYNEDHIANTPVDQRIAAESVTLSHLYLWDKIAQSGEAACIVEHDFVFKNDIGMIIPDGFIIGLGYKVAEPDIYKNEFENIDDKPKEIILADKILGAHGYAITAKTAQRLVDEVKVKGIQGWIDCVYFQGNPTRLTDVCTSMLSPPPGIAWLRESTIWSNTATLNYKCIDSFVKRCKSEYTNKQRNEMSRHHFASLKMRSV